MGPTGVQNAKAKAIARLKLIAQPIAYEYSMLNNRDEVSNIFEGSCLGNIRVHHNWDDNIWFISFDDEITEKKDSPLNDPIKLIDLVPEFRNFVEKTRIKMREARLSGWTKEVDAWNAVAADER